MKFHRRASGTPHRVAVFPGSFNPPTVAHLALADKAAQLVDEVIFVLPEVFPHKDFSGVGFDDRLGLLLKVTNGRHFTSHFTVASTQGGLFIDMARELRPHYADAKLHFLCGRDAAERIVGWDYGDGDYGEPGMLERMFAEFSLLVAARNGHYEPPAIYAGSIAHLPLERDFGDFSATQVRNLAARNGDLRDLIPAEIVSDVARLYRA